MCGPIIVAVKEESLKMIMTTPYPVHLLKFEMFGQKIRQMKGRPVVVSRM